MCLALGSNLISDESFIFYTNVVVIFFFFTRITYVLSFFNKTGSGSSLATPCLIFLLWFLLVSLLDGVYSLRCRKAARSGSS